MTTPSNHKLLTDLLTAGLSPELVARVAEACAESYARGMLDAQPQRSKAAERQARYRERNAVTQASQSVTERNEASRRDNSLSPTPPIPNKINKKSSMHDSRGTRLQADWKPNERNVLDAKSEGLNDAHIAQQSARFRDFWIAKSGQGGVKRDWDATWRNWCRNHADRVGLQRPSQDPSTSTMVFVPADSEAFAAWERHLGKKNPRNKANGWHFPSEYPPGHERAA